MESVPNILIVHLKRFKVYQNYMKKLNYSINIPDNINLDFLLNEKNKNKKEALYSLSAVVVHVGSGIEYGHYFSLVKHFNKWYKCDDENIHVIIFYLFIYIEVYWR